MARTKRTAAAPTTVCDGAGCGNDWCATCAGCAKKLCSQCLDLPAPGEYKTRSSLEQLDRFLCCVFKSENVRVTCSDCQNKPAETGQSDKSLDSEDSSLPTETFDKSHGTEPRANVVSAVPLGFAGTPVKSFAAVLASKDKRKAAKVNSNSAAQLAASVNTALTAAREDKIRAEKKNVVCCFGLPPDLTKNKDSIEAAKALFDEAGIKDCSDSVISVKRFAHFKNNVGPLSYVNLKIEFSNLDTKSLFMRQYYKLRSFCVTEGSITTENPCFCRHDLSALQLADLAHAKTVLSELRAIVDCSANDYVLRFDFTTSTNFIVRVSRDASGRIISGSATTVVPNCSLLAVGSTN